tara:strand:+ start:1117 stop:1887 length:771 start_codon:yes stop_codon:yes gene_type:complete
LEIKFHLSEFKEKGFTIIPIKKTDEFIKSRSHIAEFIRSKYSCVGNDEEILNNCHNYIENISESKVNSLIINIINDFKKFYEMDKVVYETSKEFILGLLGSDIASQKNPNIVFQHPHSSRTSELHRDAPANSIFEIVSWVPLVDCYKSKSFYILDKYQSKELIKKHKNNSFSSWNEYRNMAIEKSIKLEINYGSALFFWSGLLHGSVTNETNESRWSYNIRYKNLFAPAGLKDPLAFYRVFKKSPITDLASEEIKK